MTSSCFLMMMMNDCMDIWDTSIHLKRLSFFSSTGERIRQARDAVRSQRLNTAESRPSKTHIFFVVHVYYSLSIPVCWCNKPLYIPHKMCWVLSECSIGQKVFRSTCLSGHFKHSQEVTPRNTSTVLNEVLIQIHRTVHSFNSVRFPGEHTDADLHPDTRWL